MMADACLCSVSHRLTEDRSRAIRKVSSNYLSFYVMGVCIDNFVCLVGVCGHYRWSTMCAAS